MLEMDDDVLGLQADDLCPRCGIGMLVGTPIGASRSDLDRPAAGTRGLRCTPRDPRDNVCAMEWVEISPGLHCLRYPAV